MKGNQGNDAVRVREFVEDLHSICGRARRPPASRSTEFELLAQNEKARFLQRLDFLEQWARKQRGEIVDETEEKNGSQ